MVTCFFNGVKSQKKHKTIMDPSNPHVARVTTIVTKIAESNKDLENGIVKEQNWRVVIIENDKIINAATTPGGTIYVFTGLLKNTPDDHTLACVIGHEMSHVSAAACFLVLSWSAADSTG